MPWSTWCLSYAKITWQAVCQSEPTGGEAVNQQDVKLFTCHAVRRIWRPLVHLCPAVPLPARRGSPSAWPRPVGVGYSKRHGTWSGLEHILDNVSHAMLLARAIESMDPVTIFLLFEYFWLHSSLYIVYFWVYPCVDIFTVLVYVYTPSLCQVSCWMTFHCFV